MELYLPWSIYIQCRSVGRDLHMVIFFESVGSPSTCVHGHREVGDHSEWSNFDSSMSFEKGFLIDLRFARKVRRVGQQAQGICPLFTRIHPCLTACCCFNMGPGRPNSDPHAYKAETLYWLKH